MAARWDPDRYSSAAPIRRATTPRRARGWRNTAAWALAAGVFTPFGVLGIVLAARALVLAGRAGDRGGLAWWALGVSVVCLVATVAVATATAS
jgi:hypothetical protein